MTLYFTICQVCLVLILESQLTRPYVLPRAVTESDSAGASTCVRFVIFVLVSKDLSSPLWDVSSALSC